MLADTVRLQSLISDVAEKNRAHICGLFVIVREGGDAEASFDGRALASRFSSVSSPIPAEMPGCEARLSAGSFTNVCIWNHNIFMRSVAALVRIGRVGPLDDFSAKRCRLIQIER